MWKIKQIFDGDYGCEELQPGQKLITATNKWILAHAESSEAKDGAWVGITGENIDIADDI